VGPRERARDRRRSVRVAAIDACDHVATRAVVARSRVQHDSGTGARCHDEIARAFAERDGVEARDEPVALGTDERRLARDRERIECAGHRTLRRKHRVERLGRATARERVGERTTRIAVVTGDAQKRAPERVAHGCEALITTGAAQKIARFDRLDAGTDRGAERFVHIGHERERAPAEPLGQAHERLREFACVGFAFEKRAATGLYVVDDRARAARDLLRDDRCGDQSARWNGRRPIAQRIEEFVRGDEPRPLRGDRAPYIANDREESLGREIRSDARDRLEFVERTARVSERAAGELRKRNAARGNERHDDERRRIGDASRTVFVDRSRIVRDERLAARDERFGQGVRFVERHPAEHARHQQRRRLCVVDLACERRSRDVGIGPRVEFAAVAFVGDRTPHLRFRHEPNGIRFERGEARRPCCRIT